MNALAAAETVVNRTIPLEGVTNGNKKVHSVTMNFRVHGDLPDSVDELVQSFYKKNQPDLSFPTPEGFTSKLYRTLGPSVKHCDIQRYG